jgi:hypothetical protein
MRYGRRYLIGLGAAAPLMLVPTAMAFGKDPLDEVRRLAASHTGCELDLVLGDCMRDQAQTAISCFNEPGYSVQLHSGPGGVYTIRKRKR